MAYIQRRSTKDGESWRVGWREDGKQVWSPAIWSGDGAVEFKELVENLGGDAALAILDKREGRDVVTGPPLLRDWFDRHLELLGGSATEGTVEGYRKEAERTWLPRLGALPIDAITRETVMEWVAWQRKNSPPASPRTGPSRPTRRSRSGTRTGTSSSTLRTAVEHGKGIVANPAHGVKIGDDAEAREMAIFTEDEWLAFIGGMDPHYLPLTYFLLSTGCRIGEATAVQARDINLYRGTVTFLRAWKKGPRGSRVLGSLKGKRERRTVALPVKIIEQVRELIEGKGAEEFVFLGRRGGRIQPQHFRNRQWAAALEAAGTTKSLTPHSLRHTSASWLLADNVSPLVVQHRLGHESLTTTSKVYAHLLTDAQAGAVETMHRAIGA